MSKESLWEGVNVFAAVIAVLLEELLLCGAAYASAPETEKMNWSLLNPVEFLSGILFALSFGAGWPIWLSVVLLVIVLLGILFLFYRLLCRVM